MACLPLRKLDNYKHVLQSTKKLYGCLAAHPRAVWCFVTDSETLLIRCAIHLYHATQK